MSNVRLQMHRARSIVGREILGLAIVAGVFGTLCVTLELLTLRGWAIVLGLIWLLASIERLARLWDYLREPKRDA